MHAEEACADRRAPGALARRRARLPCCREALCGDGRRAGLPCLLRPARLDPPGAAFQARGQREGPRPRGRGDEVEDARRGRRGRKQQQQRGGRRRRTFVVAAVLGAGARARARAAEEELCFFGRRAVVGTGVRGRVTRGNGGAGRGDVARGGLARGRGADWRRRSKWMTFFLPYF